MAPKTSQDRETSLPASSDGVAALDRAIAILNAFKPQDRSLSLAEISARTGLYKSTILRLAGSLIRGHLLERLPDGLYRIGSGAFRLGAIYQRSVATADILLPIMYDLAEESGESVAFYAPAGNLRTCLYRIESKHPIRYHVREGDVLPLHVGSGGRVLAAFSGKAGEPYETIRRNYYFVSLGDRDPDTAGLSVPVFGPGAALVGAITLAGPRMRISDDFIGQMKRPLLTAAARATRAFGGDPLTLERVAYQNQA
ncbi:IclR family transcriptional regulator (plasmid) [Microvirga sp. RSM25]|uniref:IclR family transcriptional regulator n=1 Tax=Microvirga sp. RSM25 TaxID=3273802 RepID=UPI00384CE3D0